MIKYNVIFYVVILSVFSGSSYASDSKSSGIVKQADTVIVYSTVRDLSAMAIGNEILYTKAFDVTIANSGEKSLDLSKGCFKAVMPDKTEHSADTIDQALSKGLLKATDHRKSFVAFSSYDESIYKASAVKYLLVCK